MLCEDNASKLLGLEDVIVKKVWNDGEKHIEIELPPEDCSRWKSPFQAHFPPFP